MAGFPLSIVSQSYLPVNKVILETLTCPKLGLIQKDQKVGCHYGL